MLPTKRERRSDEAMTAGTRLMTAVGQSKKREHAGSGGSASGSMAAERVQSVDVKQAADKDNTGLDIEKNGHGLGRCEDCRWGLGSIFDQSSDDRSRTWGSTPATPAAPGAVR